MRRQASAHFFVQIVLVLAPSLGVLANPESLGGAMALREAQQIVAQAEQKLRLGAGRLHSEVRGLQAILADLLVINVDHANASLQEACSRQEDLLYFITPEGHLYACPRSENLPLAVQAQGLIHESVHLLLMQTDRDGQDECLATNLERAVMSFADRPVFRFDVYEQQCAGKLLEF